MKSETSPTAIVRVCPEGPEKCNMQVNIQVYIYLFYMLFYLVTLNITTRKVRVPRDFHLIDKILILPTT